MAYIFVGAIIIGIPFYLLYHFIRWIFFSDNPNSKMALLWENIISTLYIITIIIFIKI